MRFITTIAVLFAITAPMVTSKIDPGVLIGHYYRDTACGGGTAKDIHQNELQSGVLLFNTEQDVKAVRMDHKSFTIYNDQGCSKNPRGNGAGGCAHLGGETVQCLRVAQ